MLDMTIVHKPALARVKFGSFGARNKGEPALLMQARPEALLLHVLGAPGCGDLAPIIALSGIGDVRFASAGQWFVVSDKPASGNEIATLAARLGEKAAISDQTHGRVRISLMGARAADLLAKGTAIDLHRSVFAPGKSCMTMIGHIGVNLARTGHESFELMVLRGFAESLWNDLIHMGLEYGIKCVPAEK